MTGISQLFTPQVRIPYFTRNYINHTDMPDPSKISFQFISEPSDVNFGGKVHGGVVMKWIDQTAYACARLWA